MSVIRLRDFTRTPGGRLRGHGPWSAEEWRDDYLVDAFVEARLDHQVLVVDLDGVVGFAASFIAEAFGGLPHKIGADSRNVWKHLEIRCQDEPGVIEDIREMLCGPLTRRRSSAKE
jgi:hypothetical protein